MPMRIPVWIYRKQKRKRWWMIWKLTKIKTFLTSFVQKLDLQICMCDCCLFITYFLFKHFYLNQKKSCVWALFVFSVMLNHHCSINMSCTIINFDRATPSLRLFYTVQILILTGIPFVRWKGPIRLLGTRM